MSEGTCGLSSAVMYPQLFSSPRFYFPTWMVSVGKKVGDDAGVGMVGCHRGHRGVCTAYLVARTLLFDTAFFASCYCRWKAVSSMPRACFHNLLSTGAVARHPFFLSKFFYTVHCRGYGIRQDSSI